MKLHNEPNVKQEQKLLKIIVISTLVAAVLGAVFFFAGNLLPSTKTKAATPTVYTMSGDINSSGNTSIMNTAVSGDTIKITGLLKVNATQTNLNSKNVIILINGGTMRWDGRFKIYLGSNAKVLLANGGQLTCNSTSYGGDPSLFFNSVKIVSYNGTDANYSFSQVNSTGGVKYSGLTTLPVKLVRFETLLEKGKVIIKWATATEVNNDHFDIERSNDTKTWKVIGTVKGNGNSSSLMNYGYTDNPGIITGTLYYRLHQVDFDGANEYGPVSTVDNKQKEKSGKVYPNPANEVIKVSLNADAYQLTILDQSGKVVIAKQVNSDFESVDCKELPNGYYFVKLENETISESHKIVVRH